MMKRHLFLFAAAVTLAACGPTGQLPIPESPGAVADRTTIDEKAGIAAETAYTAAARAAAIAIRTGLISDAATIKRIGELDVQAKSALQATRDAYSATNAAAYDEGFRRLNAAVKAMLALVPSK